MANFVFFKKKEVWVPTWKTVLLAILLMLSFVFLFFTYANSFLSLNKPVEAEVLLVDDWLPDYAIEETLQEFTKHDYRKLIITGGRQVYGWNATKFESTAELLAAKIMERGVDSAKIQLIKVSPSPNNRTNSSSLAARDWLVSHPNDFNAVNVVSIGSHARRSYYLFNKSLGDQCRVGIISINNIAYDQNKWWTSSYGFKEVITEFLAYVYTILFI